MNDEEQEIDWKAFRANRPHKNHKQPRRGATVTAKADKPDPRKPVVNYDLNKLNVVQRLNPFQQELAKAHQKNRK